MKKILATMLLSSLVFVNFKEAKASNFVVPYAGDNLNRQINNENINLGANNFLRDNANDLINTINRYVGENYNLNSFGGGIVDLVFHSIDVMFYSRSTIGEMTGYNVELLRNLNYPFAGGREGFVFFPIFSAILANGQTVNLLFANLNGNLYIRPVNMGPISRYGDIRFSRLPMSGGQRTNNLLLLSSNTGIRSNRMSLYTQIFNQFGGILAFGMNQNIQLQNNNNLLVPQQQVVPVAQLPVAPTIGYNNGDANVGIGTEEGANEVGLNFVNLLETLNNNVSGEEINQEENLAGNLEKDNDNISENNDEISENRVLLNTKEDTIEEAKFIQDKSKEEEEEIVVGNQVENLSMEEEETLEIGKLNLDEVDNVVIYNIVSGKEFGSNGNRPSEDEKEQSDSGDRSNFEISKEEEVLKEETIEGGEQKEEIIDGGGEQKENSNNEEEALLLTPTSSKSSAVNSNSEGEQETKKQINKKSDSPKLISISPTKIESVDYRDILSPVSNVLGGDIFFENGGSPVSLPKKKNNKRDNNDDESESSFNSDSINKSENDSEEEIISSRKSLFGPAKDAKKKDDKTDDEDLIEIDDGESHNIQKKKNKEEEDGDFDSTSNKKIEVIAIEEEEGPEENSDRSEKVVNDKENTKVNLDKEDAPVPENLDIVDKKENEIISNPKEIVNNENKNEEEEKKDDNAEEIEKEQVGNLAEQEENDEKSGSDAKNLEKVENNLNGEGEERLTNDLNEEEKVISNLNNKEGEEDKKDEEITKNKEENNNIEAALNSNNQMNIGVAVSRSNSVPNFAPSSPLDNGNGLSNNPSDFAPNSPLDNGNGLTSGDNTGNLFDYTNSNNPEPNSEAYEEYFPNREEGMRKIADRNNVMHTVSILNPLLLMAYADVGLGIISNYKKPQDIGFSVGVNSNVKSQNRIIGEKNREESEDLGVCEDIFPVGFNEEVWKLGILQKALDVEQDKKTVEQGRKAVEQNKKVGFLGKLFSFFSRSNTGNKPSSKSNEADKLINNEDLENNMCLVGEEYYDTDYETGGVCALNEENLEMIWDTEEKKKSDIINNNEEKGFFKGVLKAIYEIFSGSEVQNPVTLKDENQQFPMKLILKTNETSKFHKKGVNGSYEEKSKKDIDDFLIKTPFGGFRFILPFSEYSNKTAILAKNKIITDKIEDFMKNNGDALYLITHKDYLRIKNMNASNNKKNASGVSSEREAIRGDSSEIRTGLPMIGNDTIINGDVVITATNGNITGITSDKQKRETLGTEETPEIVFSKIDDTNKETEVHNLETDENGEQPGTDGNSSDISNEQTEANSSTPRGLSEFKEEFTTAEEAEAIKRAREVKINRLDRVISDSMFLNIREELDIFSRFNYNFIKSENKNVIGVDYNYMDSDSGKYHKNATNMKYGKKEFSENDDITYGFTINANVFDTKIENSKVNTNLINLSLFNNYSIDSALSFTAEINVGTAFHKNKNKLLKKNFNSKYVDAKLSQSYRFNLPELTYIGIRNITSLNAGVLNVDGRTSRNYNLSSFETGLYFDINSIVLPIDIIKNNVLLPSLFVKYNAPFSKNVRYENLNLGNLKLGVATEFRVGDNLGVGLDYIKAVRKGKLNSDTVNLGVNYSF